MGRKFTRSMDEAQPTFFLHHSRGYAMLRQAILCGVIVLLQPFVLRADAPDVDEAKKEREIINIEGDVVVDKALTLENQHLRIRGNLILAKGGDLTLKNCACELLCRFSREFIYEWRGGVLRTENVTIGGTEHFGYFAPANFHLFDGEWHAVDTTVGLSYGIVFSDKTVGKLRAKRLKRGPCPDSVIVSGKCDVVVEDSDFRFALNLSALKGGRCELDLPVDESFTRVFDGTVLSHPDARLDLRNVTVANWWWVFVRDVSMDGPEFEVVLSSNGKVIPGIMGHNLRGSIPFAINLEQPFRAGPVTIRRATKTLKVDSMSYYLTGAKSDVLVPGPTRLNEVMVWDGKMQISGTPGTHDIVSSCTSYDVHGQAELTISNARLGIPAEWLGWKGRGQITVSDDARLIANHCDLHKIHLLTNDRGKMTFRASTPAEEVVLEQRGGSISFLPDEVADSAGE